MLASKEHDSNGMKADWDNLYNRYSRFWRRDLTTLLKRYHLVTEGLPVNLFHPFWTKGYEKFTFEKSALFP